MTPLGEIPSSIFAPAPARFFSLQPANEQKDRGDRVNVADEIDGRNLQQRISSSHREDVTGENEPALPPVRGAPAPAEFFGRKPSGVGRKRHEIVLLVGTFEWTGEW